MKKIRMAPGTNSLLALTIVTTPAMEALVSTLRDERTENPAFEQAARKLAVLLFNQASHCLTTQPYPLTTPSATQVRGVRFDPADLVLVPILRSGRIMADAIEEFYGPQHVKAIDVKRDHTTLQAGIRQIDFTQEDIHDKDVLVLDPMLATGGSASATIAAIKAFKPRTMSLLSFFAAPEGIKRINQDHYLSVAIIVAALDKRLNQLGYILPGCGDFGDRLYGKFVEAQST